MVLFAYIGGIKPINGFYLPVVSNCSIGVVLGTNLIQEILVGIGMIQELQPR